MKGNGVILLQGNINYDMEWTRLMDRKIDQKTGCVRRMKGCVPVF